MITHVRMVAELNPGDILVVPDGQSAVTDAHLAGDKRAWITSQPLEGGLPVRTLHKLTDRVVIREVPDDIRTARHALQKVRLRIKQNMSADTVERCNEIIDDALRALGAI